ncbi:ribosome-binding protein aMBF1 (putative translation factor) [Bradyrhizobium diazoefficiens]|uniref:helix-turn-helix transcriptional regulator n=1 Tax=Bradyrhizobium diazoefficiens TaxID=1355477 RepID=UPI00272D1445|nr:helix-turn-helix transcriptional regulator [Bradyrhizobium diazoefficiens]WLA57485.1 helix-turn-helix transcriptional regulator [Bradyrhizobium diazoefficiens]
MKKPTKTAATSKAGPKRGPGTKIGALPKAEDDGKTNKPFAERFKESRLSTAEILGENVKRLRTGLELSQADLARALRTDQSAIGLIEIKRANPTLRTMEKLAAVLKTTVVDLLSRPKRRRTRT